MLLPNWPPKVDIKSLRNGNFDGNFVLWTCFVLLVLWFPGFCQRAESDLLSFLFTSSKRFNWNLMIERMQIGFLQSEKKIDKVENLNRRNKKPNGNDKFYFWAPGHSIKGQKCSRGLNENGHWNYTKMA